MTDVTEKNPIDEELEAELDDVRTDAKDGFNTPEALIDHVRNRNMRVIKVDMGYDEVNSEKLVAIETALGQLNVIVERAERNSSGIDEFKKVVTQLKRNIKKSVEPEEIARLEAELAETETEIEGRAALAENLKPLRAQVEDLNLAAAEVRSAVASESLSVELRAIPYRIARGAARRARKTLGITEKGIPADMQDDFEEEQLMELAYDQCVRYRDNRDGSGGTKLPMELIHTIRDFMPLSQSNKFFNAVADLQFTNAISESAVAQADF